MLADQKTQAKVVLHFVLQQVLMFAAFAPEGLKRKIELEVHGQVPGLSLPGLVPHRFYNDTLRYLYYNYWKNSGIDLHNFDIVDILSSLYYSFLIMGDPRTHPFSFLAIPFHLKMEGLGD